MYSLKVIAILLVTALFVVVSSQTFAAGLNNRTPVFVEEETTVKWRLRNILRRIRTDIEPILGQMFRQIINYGGISR